MEQSPVSEANNSSASQEMSRILWNPKVYYPIHKSSSPVPILSQIDPVRNPLPLLEDPFYVILSSTAGSSKWSVEKSITLFSCSVAFVPPNLLYTHQI